MFGLSIENPLLRHVLLAYSTLRNPPLEGGPSHQLRDHIDIALQYFGRRKDTDLSESDFFALTLLGIVYALRGSELQAVVFLKASIYVLELVYDHVSNRCRSIYPLFFFAAQSFPVSPSSKDEFFDYTASCRRILPLLSSEYQQEHIMTWFLTLRDRVTRIYQAFGEALALQTAQLPDPQQSSSAAAWSKEDSSPPGKWINFEALLATGDDQLGYAHPWISICYFASQFFMALLESRTFIEGLLRPEALYASESIMQLLSNCSRTPTEPGKQALTIEVVKYFWYFLLVNPQRWSPEGTSFYDYL